MLVPTGRAFLLALGAVPLMIFVGSVQAALLAGGLWLSAVAVLATVDSLFVPASRDLIWERSHDSKLSLGAWNSETLRLTNRTARPTRFTVREAFPQLLLSGGDTASGECQPGSSWCATLTVFPIFRGDHEIGPLTARYLGPLGLAWRQRTEAGTTAVKVYPNLLAVRQYEALLRRGHLFEIGLRRARKLGSGIEFERLREYSPDDEYRRINWTATARRHVPTAVEYETERSQNVMLLIDSGRLMSTQVPYAGETDGDLPWQADTDEPSRVIPALTRLDHSINAALLLAYVAVRSGDRAGLLGFSDRVLTFVRPGPGKRQFLILTEALYNLQPQKTEADYGDALAHLSARSPRRSLAVIFTDIAHQAAADSLLTHVSRLAQRHLPLVVTMRDPAVDALATASVSDARTVYQRAVARDLLDQREVVLGRLRQHGALTLDVPADRLTPSVINRYLQVKARGEL